MIQLDANNTSFITISNNYDFPIDSRTASIVFSSSQSFNTFTMSTINHLMTLTILNDRHHTYQISTQSVAYINGTYDNYSFYKVMGDAPFYVYTLVETGKVKILNEPTTNTEKTYQVKSDIKIYKR